MEHDIQKIISEMVFFENSIVDHPRRWLAYILLFSILFSILICDCSSNSMDQMLAWV